MVIRVNKTNRNKALGILFDAFKANPNISWMAEGKGMKGVYAICEYCLDNAIAMDGAFLSLDHQGVLLAYNSKQIKSWKIKLQKTKNFIKLYRKTLSFRKFFRLIKQQRHIPLLPLRNNTFIV